MGYAAFSKKFRKHCTYPFALHLAILLSHPQGWCTMMLGKTSSSGLQTSYTWLHGSGRQNEGYHPNPGSFSQVYSTKTMAENSRIHCLGFFYTLLLQPPNHWEKQRNCFSQLLPQNLSQFFSPFSKARRGEAEAAVLILCQSTSSDPLKSIKRFPVISIDLDHSPQQTWSISSIHHPTENRLTDRRAFCFPLRYN